jgi:hypothetical protein
MVLKFALVSSVGGMNAFMCRKFNGNFDCRFKSFECYNGSEVRIKGECTSMNRGDVRHRCPWERKAVLKFHDNDRERDIR